MAKNEILRKVLGFVIWLTGVIVSLAVAFAMTSGDLTVPYIPNEISIIAGWIVIITTILGIALALVDYFS